MIKNLEKYDDESWIQISQKLYEMNILMKSDKTQIDQKRIKNIPDHLKKVYESKFFLIILVFIYIPFEIL